MKLEKTGYATRVSPEKARTSKESWFIPHHLVTHNGKNRVVFNCSFTYKDQNLNELLLSGPNLGASLLGVLLRFREHSTAVSSFSELVKATARHLHGAAADEEETPTAEKFKEAELSILRSAQRDSFPEEVQCLAAGKPVPSSSCLITLAPEYDVSLRLIRVGGRLRRCQELEPDVIHPVVLDPRHVVTKLLIRQVDSDLKHPGAERLFAELRRKFWILRGREAIRREQRSCPECQRWRAQPVNPKMADLPPARLRLYRPPFSQRD
ncbi:hypothetical protein AAFF_G00158550 [Aldrovandia affinis]|uniref:Integrase zinc-binding domain-containing protein n=1 Tax=Aldrovandia affinis TaxID=143900 RepID=A0AAD7R0I6_9TELE|nr:hypothetical protein AAFF_G00158550 [Aldrovandia affinis]